ncbi:MAG: hypothetical protein JW828_03550 [Sedimentisphaerales bacterium]|nr:hypothetical protein [Sedimentisphaerales bacterium]
MRCIGLTRSLFFASFISVVLLGARVLSRPIQYSLDKQGLRLEGVGPDNPMIYDNDWWFDTPDKNYLWAMASLGKADLRANIVSRDMWNWQNGYLYKLEQGMEDARKSIEIARRSGVRNIPDAIAGCDRAFERPQSGRIEDTKIIPSKGSERIVAEARKATAQKPLLIFVGGPLNTVANALVMDPTIADRIVVFMTDLVGYNGKDSWANYIVAKRCRLINYGAHVWWPQRPEPPVMPLERFKDLPNSEQTRDLYRIAKWFWDRSTKEKPDRDDGFADGAPIFLVFHPKSWLQVRRQRVAGVFRVQDVDDQSDYDLLDARRLDYEDMTEAFFSCLKEPAIYARPTEADNIDKPIETGIAVPTNQALLDPQAEFEAAQKAEKAGDFETALTHYENIFDATRTQMKFPPRAMLQNKLGELKRKVAPNADPAKAGRWKVKAYAFRTTDVKWTDEEGKERHACFQFTDPQIENLRLEMTNFAAKVWDYTHGNLRIVWDLTVIDKPLTEWHGWPDLGVCMPYFTDLKHGEADSLFVFAKAAGGPEDKPCDPLHWDLWGGTIGVTAETKGACYIGFNCGPEPAQNSSGELELHEWTHAAEMAMRWAQAYEDGDVVDWSGDDGDFCETWDLWKRPAGEETWLDFYRTIFHNWTTRKMWRELTVTERRDNPWLKPYVREYLALGPFKAEGKMDGGLNEAFIDEAGVQPKLGQKTGGLEWKRADCPGKFATLTPVFANVGDDKVYYLAFTARAAQSQPALLHIQRDGMCKIRQNGRLVYSSQVNREWSSRPNVLDIPLAQGDNRFLIKLTNISGDWSFSLKLTDLQGEALPDVAYSAL